MRYHKVDEGEFYAIGTSYPADIVLVKEKSLLPVYGGTAAVEYYTYSRSENKYYHSEYNSRCRISTNKLVEADESEILMVLAVIAE